MKQIELTVLKDDADSVIQYLGRKGIMQFSSSPSGSAPPDFVNAEAFAHIQERIEHIKAAADYLSIVLPGEPDEQADFPQETQESLLTTICTRVEALHEEEQRQIQEGQQAQEALFEAQAFSNLNVPFSDLDQLSYLTLRVGRLESHAQSTIVENLAKRVVFIPLDQDTVSKDGQNVKETTPRVLALTSRKGRFALDSELKRSGFEPITIPKDFKGIPQDLLQGLQVQLSAVEAKLKETAAQKAVLQDEYRASLLALNSSYLMAALAAQLKQNLIATQTSYLLRGWVPADLLGAVVKDLTQLTDGRLAVHSFNPDELPAIRSGEKKVPVSLSHGAFVRGFEGLVFSYGTPLYGTIDPTPFVAVFFTILFGIMFGDLGQGFVLLLLGILTRNSGSKLLASFGGYSTPLIAVGCSSMVMGFLTGAVFTNEELLVGPTRALSGFILGRPVDRFLTLMPLAENGGSVVKLFYFFGFTIGVGIILNTIGLVINIVNQCVLKRYEEAFFSKTGIAGITLFWCALAIGISSALGGSFHSVYLAGLFVPLLAIFFGPIIWRLVSGERPVLEHGLMIFIMEGFVEILETISTYISNTVSFLRVGAFALSHAVLSYIVFRFSEELAVGVVGGGAAALIMVFGNLVIIVLEGMIVAIQVVRLQYYEFFSKFFTETGVRFAPFRFRK
ncbi:V-type ATP synthase subunit I [Breznakiellaceae bacterium SP9]